VAADHAVRGGGHEPARDAAPPSVPITPARSRVAEWTHDPRRRRKAISTMEDEQAQRDKDFDPELQAEVAPEQNSEADKQMRSWADDDKKDDLPNVL
jgi:hypothetical protein